MKWHRVQGTPTLNTLEGGGCQGTGVTNQEEWAIKIGREWTKAGREGRETKGEMSIKIKKETQTEFYEIKKTWAKVQSRMYQSLNQSFTLRQANLLTNNTLCLLSPLAIILEIQ